MTLLIFTIILFGAAGALGIAAARRGEAVLWGGVKDAWGQLAFTAPRLVLGVIGAGFLAELLPAEVVRALLGRDAGLLGVVIAAGLGAVAPGGPALVFAVAGAAAAAGAGEGQVMAFTTAWMLFSFNKALVWEQPFLGGRYTRDRMIFAAPAPFLVGAAALWLFD
ncbi:MAG: hypothetical protein MRY74_11600 [Neomegalonema sp.]|nr:hypothetical protein [Neomegalonema sp.]